MDTRNLVVSAPVKGATDTTSLHICAANYSLAESAEVAALLVAAQADVNARSKLHKETPLHLAAFTGHVPMVRFLMESRAEIDPVNAWGHTPLTLAAQCGRTDAAKALVEGAANWRHQVTEEGGLTAVEIASRRRHENTAAMLRDHEKEVLRRPPEVVVEQVGDWKKVPNPQSPTGHLWVNLKTGGSTCARLPPK